MNLLFAINKNFVPLLCSCLSSIAKNGGEDHYDAYILHSDLGEREETEIKNAAPAVTVHFIKVDAAIFEGFPESDRYPKQIYYRLAAPLLLPRELDRILYLDVDLVVINPLRELYSMDFTGNLYIACSHVSTFLRKFNQARLGIREDVPYINTGMMLMDLTAIRKDLTLEKIRQTAEQKMHSFWLPDQDLLTVMHGDRIKLVDTMRYNLSDRMLSLYNADPRHEKRDLDWVRENAVIIHYYGKNRPWNGDYNGILDTFYWEAIDNNGMPNLKERKEGIPIVDDTVIQAANAEMPRFGMNRGIKDQCESSIMIQQMISVEWFFFRNQISSARILRFFHLPDRK